MRVPGPCHPDFAASAGISMRWWDPMASGGRGVRPSDLTLPALRCSSRRWASSRSASRDSGRGRSASASFTRICAWLISWCRYDFASAVSFIEHEPIVPDLLQAWITGYRRVTTLSSEDVAEIPTFVVLRRILLMAWLASHAEIPFARQFGEAYTTGTLALADQLQRGRLLNQVA